MKIIIHMGDSYPNEGPNAKRMRTFYEAFTEKGHEVIVLAPTTDKKQEVCKDVIYCYTTPLKKKTTLSRTLNQCLFGIHSVWAARKIKKADVIITTSPPALLSPFGWLIGRLVHAKIVYDVRDIWPDVAWEMGSFSKNSLYSRVFAFVRDFMLKRSDLVTAVSPGKVKKLSHYNKEASVELIPNGLDEKFLWNPEFPELVDKYCLDERKSVVYVGNLGLAQGLTQLLWVAKKAMTEGIDTQFLLFGSGVEEEKLKEYIKRYRLDNVKLCGRLENVQMYTILKHATMSFVPLVNENLKDSVPTKMFEALGVGCPVLLAACGDAADILNSTGLGIAVTPNDKEALWDAFVRIFEGIEHIKDKQMRAYELMTGEYSRQSAAKKMEALLVSRFM